MAFSRGQQVEVASKEDGFVGSYYEGTLVGEVSFSMRERTYVVEYKNLVKDDFSGPLREEVTLPELRPPPPEIKIPASGYQRHDRVDAFDNDGWWVGTITGMMGSKYWVFFETTGDEIAYPVHRLRVHQDWLNGKWVVPKRRPLYVPLTYF